MKVEIYGIRNCSTVKKALAWFESNNIEFQFHDYKKEPAKIEKLEEWQNSVSWESLLNKRGTTWKKLSPEEKETVVDAASANQIILTNNSIIKRPVIEFNGNVIVGYDETIYAELFIEK